MKTILIFVSSLDGKITKWGAPDIRQWSSVNDQEHFDTIWNNTRVIIMGSGTYLPDPVKPNSNHHFIVITRHPEEYAGKQVPGQLEFTNENPGNILARSEKSGEEKVLVVGGPHVANMFLKAKLISELWLTLEPKIFGSGGNFVIDEQLDIELKLLSCTQVNGEGTLITKWAVL